MRVAVLGLGAMGSRMAISLLKADHEVIVWNRTPAAAQALVEKGAVAAPTPRHAARDAEAVLSMVRDDQASRRVWVAEEDGALSGMSKDAIGIESSTLSIGWVHELGAMFESQGAGFIDAPVVGTRPQADAATLIHLAGGAAADIAAAAPVLAAIGNAVHHVGPVGSGAALKLLVNALLGIQIAAISELLGAAGRLGLDRRRAGEILTELPQCSPSAKGATLAILAGNFAPAFPVELVAKDLGYLEASLVGDATPVSAAARAVFENGIAAGLSAENFTAVAKLYP
jgi:3-hydroxyisobutyrate dehydrogenase